MNIDLGSLGEMIGSMAGKGSSVETLTFSARRAENGFVVTVAYPPHMIKKGPPPQVQKMVEGLSKMSKKAESGSEVGPSDIFGAFAASLQANDQKPLRRPVEEYVFPDLDKMLGFLQEVFSTSE